MGGTASTPRGVTKGAAMELIHVDDTGEVIAVVNSANEPPRKRPRLV